jgi:hypothetical protein
MSRRLLAVAGGLVIAIGALALMAHYVATTPADREFRKSFQNVEVGMAESQVLELLGRPDERSKEFFLGQRAGFEGAYQRAAATKSLYFLVWRRELDVVYSVGIDPNGRVAVAEAGGT